MDWIITGLVALVIVNLITLVWFFIRFNRKPESEDSSIENELLSLKSELLSKQIEGLTSFQNSLEQLNRTLNSRLADSSDALDKRLTVITEIENKLGQLSSQSGQLKSIGDSIQKLSDVLKPPKQRGIAGEILLENLLKDILPEPMLSFQHQYKNGKRVDAAVRIGERFLAVDSKFPLDAYQRLIESKNETDKTAAEKNLKQAIKKHINDISDKYIESVEEGFEFAVMYIPSEAVYNFLISDKTVDEFQYSLKKKVIPSSPGHLYGFLLTLTVILSRFNIDNKAREITDFLSEIEKLNSESLNINSKISGSLRSATQNVDKTEKIITDINNILRKVRELSITDSEYAEQ